MSIKLMTQVWALPVHEKCKLVLLSLADQANDDGVCWPDIDTIAARCSVSTKTVQRAISALETDGWLVVKREYGKTPIFRVILENRPVEKQPEEAPKSEKDKLSKSENEPANSDKLSQDLDKLSKSHTRTVIEPSITPTPLPASAGTGGGFPGFERWWQTYARSRRFEKAECLAIWRKKGLESRADAVIRVLLADACTPQWTKDNGQFIPHAKRWLKREMYERDVGPAAGADESKACCMCGVRGIFTLGHRRYCEAHYVEVAA